MIKVLRLIIDERAYTALKTKEIFLSKQSVEDMFPCCLKEIKSRKHESLSNVIIGRLHKISNSEKQLFFPKLLIKCTDAADRIYLFNNVFIFYDIDKREICGGFKIESRYHIRQKFCEVLREEKYYQLKHKFSSMYSMNNSKPRLFSFLNDEKEKLNSNTDMV
jgi:hypothetical protein